MPEERRKIALIIPALNEEGALGRLLPEIGIGEWVIVVDNGSTDGTARVAEEQGATVVRESRRGYGRACWSGFQEAKKGGAEIVVFMDGDGSDNPQDLPEMLAPLIDERAELVIGSRVGARSERGAVPPQARLGNWLVSRCINLLYGTDLHDIGSFRAIRCAALEQLWMSEMTFGWPVEMLVKAARSKYRIIEVPLHYRKRSHGKSKVGGTLVGSVWAAYAMLSTMVRYASARSSRYAE